VLAKDPDARPPTAEALAADLSGWLTGAERGGSRGVVGRIRTWFARSSRLVPPTAAETLAGQTTAGTWRASRSCSNGNPIHLLGPETTAKAIVPE